MGLRFQRRIKILPGLHLNLSGSGIGVSAGPRGFHVGINSRKRPYFSLGVPGTGVSYRQTLPVAPRSSDAPRPAHGLLVAIVILGLLALIADVLGR